MAVAWRDVFYVLNPLLAEVVNRKEISELPHPVGFTARSENGLTKAQIRNWLRETETQLRHIQIDGFFRHFVKTVDGALAHLRRYWRFFFVVEKLHRSAQKRAFVVEPHDFKAPAASREHVHAAVRIFAQHFIDHRGASGIHDAFFVRQDHAELQAVANYFADHFFIAVLEDVQRQFGAGQEHDLKRKERQQTRLHATIITFARTRCQNNMILKLKRTPGIYLVGFMGCGKSTVGRALADELGWSFFDLDDEIEGDAGSTISEIFDVQGEPIFRALEASALAKRVKAVQAGRPQVIALGGGAVMDDKNFELILNHGVVVWLDTPFEVIQKRIAAESHRPLARDPEKLRELFEVRCRRYALADFRVEAPEEDAMATVRRILELPLF